MNKIKLSGRVSDTPYIIHSYNKEVYYKFYIESARKSGRTDVIPCVIAESKLKEIERKKNLTIYGEIRTRNLHYDEKSHLEIYVSIDRVGDYCGLDINEVLIEQCFICSKSLLHETYTGHTIADVMLASNRDNHHSDYIPTIFWDKQAHYIKNCEVGTEALVTGQLRSRQYVKKTSDGSKEIKTVYELSALKLKCKGKECK